jgi:RyR domain
MDKSLKIVVAGDVCIDWLAYPVRPAGRALLNWQREEGTRMIPKPGGALLLSELVREATGAEVVTPVMTTELAVIPPEKILHSFTELDRFASSAAKPDKREVYRVSRFRGFAGPGAALVGVAEDDDEAHVVVLDDGGDRFRENKDCWPAAIRTEGKTPIVIVKMYRPLATGKLWKHLRKEHDARLVVVVSADDLRAEGLNISRRLSWERTATDFLRQLPSEREKRHLELAGCHNLVTRFGVDGAIHSSRAPGAELHLYYDPLKAEGEFRADYPGEMMGLASAFVAALTAHVVKELSRSGIRDEVPEIGEGICDGIRSSRRLVREGYGKGKAPTDSRGAKIFGPPRKGDPPIADVVVPTTPWSILSDFPEARLENAAYAIVREGEAVALKKVPVARFGEFTTADRAEIESLRSIKNLIREYLETQKPSRPLSIAVFGPPGAGKSFGVTEVARSVSKDVEKLEFNLAQFTSTEDLVSAFHHVRDEVLKGKVPLAFFDEFDSSFDGKLGWLKYFLVPMQDGKFKDGPSMHPIGKAIFVFAGGTSKTYAEFAGRRQTEFRTAKGPDFASRLRGYVNVLGPNQVSDDDRFVMIRRATLLRSLLWRKVRHIFDRKCRPQIDEGVVRAFLKVPEYKHGARSMEAIIDMSTLSGLKKFEQAALPPREQLELHVDAHSFSELLSGDRLFGPTRETFAEAIHEQYRRDPRLDLAEDDPAMRPWEELPESLKESNREQADQIPEKLGKVGCGYKAVKAPQPFEFTEDDLKKLAEIEHDRWVAERFRAGWTLGERNIEQRMSPYLVRWADLRDEDKRYDQETVRHMSEFMAEAGFEIYRLKPPTLTRRLSPLPAEPSRR